MAEPHEESEGHAEEAPTLAKGAPIMQKDVDKENGELPASERLAAINGKEKEDSTLSSPEVTDIPAAGENGEHPNPTEQAKDAGKTDTEATAETGPSPGAPKADGEAPKYEETETEPPADEGAGEPQEETAGTKLAKTPVATEKAPSEEIPVTEERKTLSAEARVPDLVDTSKTDEPETQVGEAEAPKSFENGEKEADDEPKAAEVVDDEKQQDAVNSNDAEEPQSEVITKEEDSAADAGESIPTEEKEAEKPKKLEEVPTPTLETGEKEAVVAGKEEIPKPEEKADDADEVAGEAIPRTVDGKTGQPNAGESIPTEEKEAEEPKKVDGATQGEVPTPAPSPVEHEQPATEPEETPKPKSFWGIVLKHVEPILPMPRISPPSSDAQDSNNVDESPEEAHEIEPVAPLVPDVAEQEVASGDAAAKDVSQKKEGEIGVEDAVRKSQTMPEEVGPKTLEDVSGRAELSENATTETLKPIEQGSVDKSFKETELPTSEMEEKQIPPFTSAMSKEIAGSASEETVPELSERTAGNTEEPKENLATITPEPKPERAGQDTTEHVTQETSKELNPEEGTAFPVKEDAVEEATQAGDGGSALEKQPSLSIYIPKQKEPAGEEGTPEETTPRGTPFMQRVGQLEQKLAQLESRQSPKSDFTPTGHSTPRSSIDRPIRHSARQVVEETGSKGTLLDRVAALEQKLAYYLNVHPSSPSNGQSTPPITTVAEDLASAPDSQPAVSQSRDWSPSAAEDDKTPDQVHEETSKAAQDPVKPAMEEKSPEDLLAQQGATAPSRSTSFNEKKIKAKVAVGQIKGFITGCFSPKKGKPVSSSP